MLKVRMIAVLVTSLVLILSACDTAAPEAVEPGTEVTTQAFWNCDKYLDSNAQRTGNNGIKYSTDVYGRPVEAYISQLGKATAPRSENCQSKVGNLYNGGTAQQRAKYQGGHLVAASLGGWGQRANLVPQAKKFNNSNWKSIERRAAKCKMNDNVDYFVSLAYKGGKSDIIPDEFFIRVKSSKLPGAASAAFDNEDNGGPGAFKKRQQVNRYLRKAGCT